MESSNTNTDSYANTTNVMTSKSSININGKQKSTCTCTLNGKKVTIECEGSDCYCDTENDEPKAYCCEGADCPDDGSNFDPFSDPGFDRIFQPREPEIPGFEEDEVEQNNDKKI